MREVDGRGPLGVGLWPSATPLRVAAVPTSFFHLRTSSFARSATSLLAFCRSLFTVTPIFVS